jgi:hypothetical protein
VDPDVLSDFFWDPFSELEESLLFESGVDSLFVSRDFSLDLSEDRESPDDFLDAERWSVL